MSKIVRITEIPWGRSGNNLISFTHGLWMAEVTQSTLEVPTWIMHILNPFELSIMHNNYCFTEEPVKRKPLEIIEITSEDSFFLFKVLNDTTYMNILPEKYRNPHNYNDVVREMSKHFVKVYTSFWSSPKHDLLAASSYLVHHYLDNKFDYTSVHIRSMEGGCNKVMNEVTNIDDFTKSGISMIESYWSNRRRNHPLCTMPYKFVRDTQIQNSHNNTKLFLSFDGRGDIGEYKASNVMVVSSLIDHKTEYKGVDRRMLDMFVAMNGNFSVLNPLSTFSWEIYVIRACLGLQTVPFISHDDFFMRKNRILNKPGLWVSWMSIRDSCLEMNA